MKLKPFSPLPSPLPTLLSMRVRTNWSLSEVSIWVSIVTTAAAAWDWIPSLSWSFVESNVDDVLKPLAHLSGQHRSTSFNIVQHRSTSFKIVQHRSTSFNFVQLRSTSFNKIVRMLKQMYVDAELARALLTTFNHQIWRLDDNVSIWMWMFHFLFLLWTASTNLFLWYLAHIRQRERDGIIVKSLR